MSKYIIHACPKRMWYVEKYLVPSLEAQGIEKDKISIRCDKYGIGNLRKCMEIFQSMRDDGGAWHLQDDIVVCHDFKERTTIERDRVICGFSWKKDANLSNIGYVSPDKMWWSFPCIYIPNHMARECASWFYNFAKDDPKYVLWAIQKQYDDYFFREFLKSTYPDKKILNLSPNLVDHIDYLIGGTTLKVVKKDKILRSASFLDTYLVDELSDRLQAEGEINDIRAEPGFWLPD